MQALSPGIRLLLFIASAKGIYKGIEYMFKKRIFISFAIEDRILRDFLVGQSRYEDSPFEFVDMSVKTPWDSAWKTNCRNRIKGCDGVVAIITRNSRNADGQLWEVKCAKEEGIPVLAIYGGEQHKNCSIPKELANTRLYNWSWNNVANFINRL